MKKLIIAAAIVCAAAFTQAASVNWAAGTGVEEEQMGYVAYCFFNNVGGSTKYSATTVEAQIAALTAGAIASDFTIELDDFGDGLSSYANDSAWVNKSTVGGFAILINSDSLETATQYTVMTANDVTFGDVADMKSFELNYSGVWNDIQSIPEPTSGLLLLLGVAGLALRRRRA